MTYTLLVDVSGSMRGRAATDRIPEDFNDGTALYEVLYGHFWEVQARGCAAGTGPRRCALVVFSAYRAIGAEVASQYIIGYVPRALPVPGAWHPVRVTVAKKGVTVRHRAGYFTPARGAQGDSETTGPKIGR